LGGGGAGGDLGTIVDTKILVNGVGTCGGLDGTGVITEGRIQKSRKKHGEGGKGKEKKLTSNNYTKTKGQNKGPGKVCSQSAETSLVG